MDVRRLRMAALASGIALATAAAAPGQRRAPV